MLSRSFVTNARSRALKIAFLAFLLAGWAAYLGGVVHAQDAALDMSAPNCEVAAAPTTDPPTIASSVSALDDFKKALLARGYNLQLNYIGDGSGNPTGGVKQGAVYEGILYMMLDADLAKIASLDGLSFRVSAFQIHGGRLSASNIFNLARVDSIEARPATRLFELWGEQKFGGLASIRIGQLAAETQFFLSEFGYNLYISSTFGWPAIFAANLPGGGPAYPLATPGVRLKVTPNDHLALLAGLYNGDPSGAGFTGLEEIKDPA